MGLRVGFLLTCTAGAFLIGAGPMVSQAFAQSAMPTNAMEPAEPIPFWWFHGEVDVGGRFFTNNPQRDGVNSAGQSSLAKYYEYSTIKPGAFSNIWLSTGSRDGLYQIDIGGKNIGYSDQSYYLEASKAGEHYFNFGWDQTPHFYSTSYQTLYNGIGTSALTLPPGLSAALFNAANNPPNAAPNNLGNYGNNVNAFTQANANAVQALINQNVHTTDVDIRRDTADVEYRWTPTTAWDIRVNYADMQRTGTQPYGATFTWGTSGVRVDIPRPVDDRTQNYGLNGEYAGTSPWGDKFNLKLAYNGSTYTDSVDGWTIQNPFCPAGASGANSCARSGSGAASAPTALMSAWPNNQANTFSGTLGADLPFKSRYMGTLSYGMMRQDQQFLPFTITPGLFVNTAPSPGVPLPANSLASLPAQNLNGAINTFLSNNVLTTQITPDLKSKLSYRYYDFHDATPSLFFPGGQLQPNTSQSAFVGADTAVPNSYPSPISMRTSYIRQDAGAELAWRASRQLNLGAAYGWERYDRWPADVAVTNENTGKIFADWTPTSWVTARATYAYSARRFDGNYDNLDNVVYNQWVTPVIGGSGNGLIENQAYRNYMYANRDRNLGKFSLAVDVTNNIRLTPTAGFKYDNYLNTINLGSLTTACQNPAGSNVNCVGAGTYSGVPLNGTQPGLKTDNSWNWGLELAVVTSPLTTFMFAYTQEHGYKDLFYCGNALPNTSTSGSVSVTSSGFCSAFSNNVNTGTGFPSGSNETQLNDRVNTFVASMRHAVIPDRLDLDMSYTLSIANSSTYFNPGPFATYGTNTNVNTANTFNRGTISVVGGPFPDVHTTYQRFDAIATYKLQQDLIERLGYKGDVSLKLRYAYEMNRVNNWANDMMQTYMYSGNNLTLPYMIWGAGNNPNYNVSLVAAALVFKW